MRKRKKHYRQSKKLLARYPKSKNREKWKASIDALHKMHDRANLMWSSAVETIASERP